MLAEQLQSLIECIAVRQHSASFSAGDGFHRVKAEGSHIRNGTRRLPFITGPDGVRAVRDERNVVFLTDRFQRFQIRGLSGIVHRHHSLGPFRHAGFHTFRINVVGFLINICKNRPRATVQCAVC